MRLTKKKQRALFAFLDALYLPVEGQPEAAPRRDTAESLIARLALRPGDREFSAFLRNLCDASVPVSEAAPARPSREPGGTDLMGRMRSFARAARLTKKEEDVLDSLFRFATREEAARHLSISTGTFKNHLSSIFDKTGADSEAQLIYLVLRRSRAGA